MSTKESNSGLDLLINTIDSFIEHHPKNPISRFFFYIEKMPDRRFHLWVTTVVIILVIAEALLLLFGR